MPQTPPKGWFDEKYSEIKKSLKDAHPDWTPETLDERSRRTVGDLWYNKLSEQEREKVLREYEGESKTRKEFEEYDKMMTGMRKDMESEGKDTEIALKIVRETKEEKPTEPENNTEIKQEEKPLHDGLNRRETEATAAKKDGSPDFVSISAYKVPYVAAPKFEGKEAPLIIKAIVLEEGHNVNNWRVVPEEFESVAAQYKAGSQLRLNHGKNVQDVIGRSFDGRVIFGRDISTYLGRSIDGIDPNGRYVAAEFEANPQEAQARTNILQGYVETGSIGLDANAFCDECGKPVKMEGEKVERTCRHYDAKFKLKNVQVKEYSYVAEPAFQHTMAFPSFSAAVDSALRDSSSIKSADNSKSIMSEKPSQVDAAKKPAESDATAEYARGYADAMREHEAYKKGVADGRKFRAEEEEEKKDEADSSAKASATPSKKTDQLGKVKGEAGPSGTSNDLIARVTEPTKFALADPAMREIFKAASSHPTTPGEIRGKLKGAFE